jgi:hypothetical protein
MSNPHHHITRHGADELRELEAGRLSIGGGWQATEKLRRNSGSSFKLMCDFAQRDGAGAYTVLFSVQSDVNQIPPVVYADVTWFVQGAAHRTVSVQNGTSIQGVAEAVEVTVRDFKRQPTAASFEEYSATILVAKGNRGQFKQPPYFVPAFLDGTVYDLGFVIVPPAGSFGFAVPRDAGIISMFTTASWNDNSDNTPIGNTDLIVQQFGTSAFKQYSANNSDWVPVIPGLESVNFINNGTPVAGAVFSIAFGIDG